jgi:hypothetical protein
MLLHISARRNIALDLLARGLVTQIEAASLIGESRQAFAYMARDIDAKTARAKHLDELWRAETAQLKQRKLKRRPTKQ